MATVNLILQGKGGVGKSVIAAMLAQFQVSKGQKPICLDTDPVNSTFVGYRSLSVDRLDIMEGEEINSRNFDKLVDIITKSNNDQHIIIDNGAASFVPLSHYLISNDVAALLSEMGHKMVIHTVVTGGQAFSDTISGFIQAVTQFPESVQFVVWLNPFWGPVELNGVAFEKIRAYTEQKNRVSNLITLPKLKEDTFGRDFSDMLKSRRTFDEAISDEKLSVMVRHRLKQVKDRIYEQLALLN